MADQDHAHDQSHPDHDHDHTHDQSHPDHDHDHDHGAATAVRQPLTATVTDAGPSLKTLTIEVPAERIASKIKDGYGKLKTEAAIPGFRRGRAPMRLIEKRFGSAVTDEVKGQLLSECYSQAIEENKIEVLGDPEIKDVANIKLPETGPLTFVVEVEVAPAFEVPSYDAISLTRPAAEVTDEMVNAELSRHAERYGEMAAVDAETPVVAGDVLQCDVHIYAGESAGAEATELQNVPSAYVLVTGEDRQFKGQLAGIIVNDLGQQLAGKKVGDVHTVSTTGPSGHEDERIKDKPITITAKITRIERIVPAALEKLAPMAGVKSVDDLKKVTREVLESRRNQQQRQSMHQQIGQFMLENVKMELPQKLSRRQTARILHRQAVDLAMKGVPEQEIAQKIAELRAGSEEQAGKQLKLFFILDKAARDMNIEVSESEVNSTISAIAMQQGRRPEKFRQELQRSGQIEQVYLEVRDQKTLDKIIEKAKVTDGEVAKA